MDVLDEILSSLRLTGGVVIDGEFSGDFCVLAQFTPQHFAPFFPQPDTLISYVAEQLSVHKRPREVRVVPSLPRNAMGKVLKKELSCRE